MAIKYFSMHFFLLFLTLMAIRTLGEQSWEQHQKGLSSGFAMMDDSDDGVGEICDPGKSNACESPTAQCAWRPLDMLYKCTEPRNYSKKRLVKRRKFKSDDKNNGTRKRMVKGFERPNTRRQDSMNSFNLNINPFHKGGKLFQNQNQNRESDLDTSSNTPPDIIVGVAKENDETTTDRFSELNTTTESQIKGRIETPKTFPTTESQVQEKVELVEPRKPFQATESNELEPATPSVEIFPDPWKATRGRQAPDPNNVGIKKKPEGTLEVPKYYGDMIWDGKTIFSKTCILKSVMAEALQERKSLESKKEWVEDNRGNICNFRRFFHCTIEQADSELVLDDGEEEELPTEPVCRCYESAMPVVKGMCYIPADLGAKSACGDHVIAPYPIQAWRRAPKLKPRCTPNSDCKESQYWFGKRCTCRYNARWNPQTHTCDKGTRLTVSLGLLFVSYAVICLKS